MCVMRVKKLAAMSSLKLTTLLSLRLCIYVYWLANVYLTGDREREGERERVP